MDAPDFDAIKQEIEFSTARSSGPGGQHVNKVNSKVILKWNVGQSLVLNEDQRNLLMAKLHSKLSKEGMIVLSSQQSRSQTENKEEVIQKLNLLIRKAFTRKKKRKPTKPTKTSVLKRAKEKKSKSEKKKWRQRPDH